MTTITEAVVEKAILNWLAQLGWQTARGPGAEALSTIEHNAFA